MNRASDLPEGNNNWGLVIAVPVCFVLAVFFVISGLKPATPQAEDQMLKASWYTPKTSRGEELQNKVMVGNCFLCHAMGVGPPDPSVIRPAFAHHVIELEHGTNNRCYNCHLIQDRNKYTANDGSGIVPKQVERLCARCHGLIFKDWQSGTHGVRRGKWSAQTEFDMQTFTCTECHDPHKPEFKFTQYTPPPVWPASIVRRGENQQKPHEASQ